jgi:GDP-4-dehydro-6-deoxy-D-mannose reductase
MRALVTGAGGFVGQWLCAELLRDGWDVHGATLTGAPAGGTLEPWQRDAVFWHDTDLREAEEVAATLDTTRPDAVFHLAAVSFVPAAEADRNAAWATNVTACTILLDAIATRRRAGTLDPVVVVAGSGEQYGAHSLEAMPLAETAEQRPASVYAETKVAQEVAAMEAWRASGTRVIAARAFNHSGPGQRQNFLLPSLVARAQEAHEQKLNAIRIGNPAAVRDFLHVEDVARAYIYLALRGVPGDAYNIASGAGVSVADLAALVIDAVGQSLRFRHPDGVRGLRAVPDQDLMRAVDVPVLVGDPGKLARTTTWQPKHTLDMLIDDLIYAETD